MKIQYIKIDYSVQSSPLSSLVLPNTRLPLNPTLRVLSYNIIMLPMSLQLKLNYFRSDVVLIKLYKSLTPKKL